LKLTIQWKVLGPVVYQEGLYFIELVIIIEYEHLFTNEVKTLKCTCELRCEVRAQFPNLETYWQVRNEKQKERKKAKKSAR
jgi:hypothetical protein